VLFLDDRLFSHVRQLKTFRDEGYNFLAYSLDIRMLDCACRNGVSAIRGEML